jgi:peptidylprolyl isomerase
MRAIWRGAALALLLAGCAGMQESRRTLEEVLGQATPTDWHAPDPARTLYLEVPAGRIVIELANDFAPGHVQNILQLTHLHYYDGLQVMRVQENYVVQWGDASGTKPLPPLPGLPDEYTRTSAGVAFTPLPDGDVYAPEVGFSESFPAARNGGAMWLAHCWSMVGVGRDMPPDNGNGAELYVVSGHAPRHLDRNLAVVGRVLSGMPFLTSLPRGTEAMGFYAKDAPKPQIQVRLAADVPVGQRTPIEVLRTDTPTWLAYVAARRHRREPFFVEPTGKIELCNTLPPVRLK